MDPTNDPNFTPPSLNKNIEPTAPSDKIPSIMPIQPFVLEELGEGVDGPVPHQRRLRDQLQPLPDHMMPLMHQTPRANITPRSLESTLS